MQNVPPVTAGPRGGNGARARGGGGRGRRVRGRRRNQQQRGEPMPTAQPRQTFQPALGVRARGAGHILFQDAEVIGALANKFYSIRFCPGQIKDIVSGTTAVTFDATRLNYEAAKFERYCIKYVNISFKSTASTTTEGQVILGILPGPNDSTITAANVTKLRPMEVGPAWRSFSISVGREVQAQPYLYCNGTDADSVAFTIYLNSTASSPGVLQLAYMVEFAFPKP